MLRQYLKTWLGFLCIFCLCAIQYTNAQTNSLSTSIQANFGIDADIKSDTLSFNIDGLIENGTDDWFLGPSGLGVIDVTNNTTILNLAAGLNINAEFRMSQPINSNINGNLWLDAVYLRDYYSHNNEKDLTIFGGGDDKNYDNPESWTFKNGSVPSKNDIIDVYGHLRRESVQPDSTNLWVFGAVSTRSQNGDNYIDFEYFRKPVTYTSPSNSGAQGALITDGLDCGHTAYKLDLINNGADFVDGDIILSINYVNGGTIANFRFYAWIDSNEIKGLDEDNSSLSDEDFTFYNENFSQRRFNFGDGAGGFEFYNCNNDPDIPFGYARISLKENTTNAIFAQDNTEGVVDAPDWGTIGPDGEVNIYYESPTFIEFALNASLLGLDGSLTNGICSAPLGTVIIKTRASASFTSELKDLAGPFSLGDISESEMTLEIECPLIIEVQCREDIPEPDVNTVIITNGGDGSEPLVQFINDVSDDRSCPEVITRTYSVTDDCGNIVYCTQLITVIDTINPEIDDFPDVTLDCNAEWPEFLTTTWADNCVDGGSIDSDAGGVITISDDGCTQSRVYTFSITDDCENSDTETTIVSRTYDMTDPEIDDLADFSLVGCNTPWPQFLATIWTDNCATGGVLNSNGGVANGSSEDGCTQYRLYTFTVTDNCGNRDTKTTRVAREYDITDPKIVDVPNFSLVGCNTPWPQFLATIWTDNCATGGVLNSNGGVANGSSEDGCTQYRLYTFTVTDNCGNRDTKTTRVAREYDITDPKIVDVPNFSLVGCNTPWPQFLATIWTDNCATGGVLNSNGGVANGSSEDGCTQYRLYTFTVTDNCGNRDTKTTRVAREYDITDPKIVNVPNFSLVGCNTPWPQFLATIWTDNCAIGGVLNSNGGVANGSSEDGCTQYRLYTFTITDNCGNRDTKTTRVAREYDISNPKIVDVPNFSLVGCNTPWPPFLATIWTDNCADGGEVQSDNGVDDGSNPDGTIEYRLYTFEVIDDCGNTDMETTRVSMAIDLSIPEIECPPMVEVQCREDIPEPKVNAVIIINGGSGGDLVVQFVDDVSDNGSCPELISRTYSATDACGNSVYCTQIIKLNDTINPEIVDLDDYTLDGCNTEWPEFLTTTWMDNCADGGSIDSDAGGDITTSDDGCTQSRVYTFTVTDDCENSDTETTTVSRTYDITNPDIVDLADYALEGCNTEWPEFLTTTWSDNCADGGEIPSDSGIDLESSPDGTIEYREYMFTVTDYCDNTVTETTIVSRDVGGNMETVRDSKCVYEDAEFDLFSYLTPGYDTNGRWEKAVGNNIILNGSFFNPSSLLDDSGNLDPAQLIDDNDQLIDDTGQPIDYIFTYTINGECSSVTKVIITLDVKCVVGPCAISIIDVTTALTPNGDNVNDTFDSGLGLGDICTVDVQIFNRWGAKIFEARDYQNDWGGTVPSNAIGTASKITTGTYYYIINYKLNGNIEETVTGYFYAATE